VNYGKNMICRQCLTLRFLPNTDCCIPEWRLSVVKLKLARRCISPTHLVVGSYGRCLTPTYPIKSEVFKSVMTSVSNLLRYFLNMPSTLTTRWVQDDMNHNALFRKFDCVSRISVYKSSASYTYFSNQVKSFLYIHGFDK